MPGPSLSSHQNLAILNGQATLVPEARWRIAGVNINRFTGITSGTQGMDRHDRKVEFILMLLRFYLHQKGACINEQDDDRVGLHWYLQWLGMHVFCSCRNQLSLMKATLDWQKEQVEDNSLLSHPPLRMKLKCTRSYQILKWWESFKIIKYRNYWPWWKPILKRHNCKYK